MESVHSDPGSIHLITLNSSPYGVPFYKAIGFAATEEEKTVNGIRFTPMEYQVEESKMIKEQGETEWSK